MVEADTRFTDEPEPGQRTEERIKPRTVGIILLLTALFAPIAASFSTSMWEGFYLSILSLPFIINYSPREGFYFYPTIYLPWGVPDIYYLMNISMLLAVYGGPRLVFSYQMVRLYKGRTTKKRTVLLGLITDCYFLFVMFPSLISMLLYPSSYFYMVLPIPIALLVALILMKIRPPSQVITPWKELDEPDKWWDKRAAPTVPPPTRKQPPDVQVDEKKDSTTKEGPWWEEEKKDKKPSEEPTSPW
jgi:accessory gene regulator protein AgrB